MVNLYDLALSSYVYDCLAPGETSPSKVFSATNGSVDLGDEEHRRTLLKWLNEWGCRHLAKEYHEMASSAILDWDRNSTSNLFPEDRVLGYLSDQEMAEAASIYGALKDKIGALHTQNGRTSAVRIGPAAASKVLFALRPKALVAWDEAIRKGFKCDEEPKSYLRFLREVQVVAQGIVALGNKIGIGIADLPGELGQPNSTMAEVINKYLWVKYARKCSLPLPRTLALWASWDDNEEPSSRIQSLGGQVPNHA